MTRAERCVIREFADRGGEALREMAIEIYRRQLREPTGPIHGNPFIDFMREIDNGVPDLALRYRARRAVLMHDAGQPADG